MLRQDANFVCGRLVCLVRRSWLPLDFHPDDAARTIEVELGWSFQHGIAAEAWHGYQHFRFDVVGHGIVADELQCEVVAAWLG